MNQHHPTGPRSGLACSLGLLLKQKRDAAGVNQQTFAQALGVSRAYLSRLERGEYKHPSPRILKRVASVLEVSADDLFVLTGDIVPQDLPSLHAYLQAKHPNWPSVAIEELVDFCDFLTERYALPQQETGEREAQAKPRSIPTNLGGTMHGTTKTEESSPSKRRRQE